MAPRIRFWLSRVESDNEEEMDKERVFGRVERKRERERGRLKEEKGVNNEKERKREKEKER
jgi:hypothetical protein